MKLNNKVKIILGCLAGALCIGCLCFVLANVNSNNAKDVNTEINVDQIQTKTPSQQSNTDSKEGTKDILVASQNPAFVQNFNPNTDDPSKIDPKDDYFVVGDGTQEVNFQNGESSYTDDEVWWEISEGTLRIASKSYVQENNLENFQPNQVTNGAPGWNSKFLPVQQIEILSDVSPTSTAYWFTTMKPGESKSHGIPHYGRIEGLNKINFTSVVDASYMFAGGGLTYHRGDLTVDGKITNLDLSNSTTNIKAMFASTNPAYYLENIDFITSNLLTNCSCLFQSGFGSIDISNMYLSSVTDASFMFANRSDLETIDFPENSIDMSNISTINAIFVDCSKLASLDLTSWQNNPKSGAIVSNAFGGCLSLENIYVNKGTDWNVEGVIGKWMFTKDEKLFGLCGHKLSNPSSESESLKLNACVDYGVVVEGTQVIRKGLFTFKEDDTEARTYIKAVKTGTEANNDVTLTFYHDEIVHEGTTYVVPETAATVQTAIPWVPEAASFTKIEFGSSFSNAPTDYWFYGFTNVGLINFPSSITSVGNYCCYNCTNLKKVVVGGDDEASVTSVGNNAFENCARLENFVIRKTDNSTTYGTDCFKNINTAGPTECAPFVGASNSGYEPSGLTFYKYVGVDGSGSDGADFGDYDDTFKHDNSYYFLKGSIVGKPIISKTDDRFKRPFIHYTACNSVLDFNGKFIDVNYTINDGPPEYDEEGSPTPKAGTAAAIYMCNRNKDDSTLHSYNNRVDDSSTLNIAHVGGIQNAYGQSYTWNYTDTEGKPHSDAVYGGGIALGEHMMGHSLNLDYVNCKIQNCRARSEGAGINIRSGYGSGATTSLKMYSGKICSNEIPLNGVNAYGGAGVKLMISAEMDMYGGSITGNTFGKGASNCKGAGLYIEGESTLSTRKPACRMHGGEIKNNTHYEEETGKSIYYYGSVSPFYALKDLADKIDLDYDYQPLYTQQTDGNYKCTGIKYQDGIKDVCMHLTLSTTFGNKGNITGMSGTFNRDTTVRKLVVEPPASAYHVEANTFNGTTNLENYVVKTTGNSNFIYEDDAFTGAGTVDDPTNYKYRAPFIIAGGTKETGITGYSISLYTYKPFRSLDDLYHTTSTSYYGLDGGAHTAEETPVKYYYYLVNDINTNTAGRIAVGAAGKTDDLVLDLNNHKIDRGFGEKTNISTDRPTAGTNYVMTTMNTCHLTFRIDNTACINDPDHIDGQITGGFATPESTKAGEPNGGGLAFTASPQTGYSHTVSFVNGCFYNNKCYGYNNGDTHTQGYGGAIALSDTSSVSNSKMTLKMYGGVIKHNIAYRAAGGYGPSSGGVDVPKSSEFDMYGGYIVDNYAADTNTRSGSIGWDAVSPGAGVGIRGGTMNMYGGIIGADYQSKDSSGKAKIIDGITNRGCWGAGIYIFWDLEGYKLLPASGATKGTLNYYDGYVFSNTNVNGTDSFVDIGNRQCNFIDHSQQTPKKYTNQYYDKE